jgi:hypothetical protein
MFLSLKLKTCDYNDNIKYKKILSNGVKNYGERVQIIKGIVGTVNLIIHHKIRFDKSAKNKFNTYRDFLNDDRG